MSCDNSSAFLSISQIFNRFSRKPVRIAARIGVLGVALFGSWHPASAQLKTATTTTLAVTSSSGAVTTAASGTVVTLTATVAGASSVLTQGQVNFCDAAATQCTDIHLLGTAQLTGAGTAKLSFRPSLGTHSYKAVFPGTNSYAGSSSGASSLAVTGTPYPLTSSTTIAETGSWGNYALTATLSEYGGTAVPTGTVSFTDTSAGNLVLTTGNLGSPVTGLHWPTPLGLTTPTNSPQAAAVGDFNGDGIPDLAVSAGGPLQPLVIFLGNANGTYTTVVGPSINTYSFGPIVVADFNGDGKQDMAVLNANSSVVTILLGNGDGTFTITGSSPASGSGPSQLAEGDFNGDGIPDLAVTDTSTNSITILLGKGDGTFTASGSPTVGSSPYAIAAGDFNGDGKLDLVVTDMYDDTVSILPGNGDGTFAAATTLHSGSLGSPIVAADFNGDGKLDLAVGVAGTNGTSDSVTILAGNGDGTFSTPQSGTAVSARSISAMQVGDFNADGIPDLILTNAQVGTFTVFVGSGTGSFTATTTSLPGSATFGLCSAVGDLNGDGRTDLLVGIYGGPGALVYLTQPMVTATAAGNVAPSSVGAHLVDASYGGDGNYNSSASATIPLWGQLPATSTTLTVTSGGAPVTSVAPGAAVTLTATVLAGTTPITSGQVRFCDASASECTDIHVLATAEITSAGTAAYKYVPGPGTHSYKAEFVQDGFGLASSSAVSSLNVGPAPGVVYSDSTSITAGGAPGNYVLTATVVGFGGSAAPTGTISFLDTNFGNTSLATAPLGAATAGIGFLASQAPALSGAPASQVAGDFNGDGIPDLAFIWSSSSYGGPYSVTVYFGKGDGTFTVGPTAAATGVQSYPVLLAGDFNSDGKTDLAVLSYDGSSISYITTLLGNGDGTFGKPQTGTAYNQGVTGGDVILGSMIAADFNGDGKLDLAVVGDYVNSGGVTVLLGKGDGTFTAKPNFAPNADFGVIATGDFNGDGIPDLVGLGYFDNRATVLLGNGDGTFTATATPPATDSFARSAVVADLNADGKLDLAVGYNGGVTVYLGKGDGTFQSGSNSFVSGPGQSVVAGDFNHDGFLDLAATSSYGGAISIYLGAGDGTFAPTVPTIAPSQQFNSPLTLVTADFNGDGASDLAVIQNFTDSPSILITEPTETATATVNNIAPVGAANHLVDASYPGDGNYPASVSATTTLTAGVALPVISPSSGAFTSALLITINDATPGAAIFYQAYGAIPTNGFVPYTGPFPLEGNGLATIQAYATASGYQQSQYALANLTANFPAAATPVISPAAGSYSAAQPVTITDSSPGATIYYTTNGTYPSTASNVYAGPIAVSSSEVVVAKAIGPGYAWSAVASAQFNIASSSSSFLYTIAGSGARGYSGDGDAATQAELDGPGGVVADSAGNLYVTDYNNNVVRKINANTGIITNFAGMGIAGHTGDNGPAASAELWHPMALATDGSGDLFVFESGDGVIRRIDAKTGTITTFAGNPTGTGSLGGPATSYLLPYIVGLACDRAGNLYIATEYPSNVFEVNAATGNITEIAGTAAGANLLALSGITVDGAQNIYVSVSASNVVNKITPAGAVTVFAGGSNGVPAGDGGPAALATLLGPQGLAVDNAGNVYIADSSDAVIREVDTSGIIHTIAGVLSSPPSYYSTPLSGDGAPATSAVLSSLQSIAVDSVGNLYFADQATSRIRKITAPAPPPLSAAALPVFSLTAGTYTNPETLTITDATPGAEIYVTLNGTTPSTADQGYHGPINITGNVTVEAVALAPGFLPSTPVTATYTVATPPSAVISTVAGSDVLGLMGVGGPATSAKIGYPEALAFDGAGNLYFSDDYNSVVWRVDASTGNITVVAGTGIPGNSIASGPATTVQLYYPEGIALDHAGNLYIADSANHRICMVSAQTGILTTIAGGVYPGVLGDGGPATSAGLYQPEGLAFDNSGNLYLADSQSQRVRRIDAKTGIITTVAGSGVYGGPSGDGGPANSASVIPTAIAFDSVGNLYITDNSNQRIRRVDASTGIITTVAGTGISGNSGDGGPATAAAILPGLGITLDGTGDIYFSSSPDTVRKVDAATGLVTTAAGSGYYGYSGDGGAASVAELNYPTGLALDAAGNLYIAEQANSTLRKVSFPGPAPTPTFSLTAGSYTGTQKLTITDSVQGASIFYTTDGTTPTAGSNIYSGPLSVSATEAVSAIAIAKGYTESGVATAAYTIKQPVTPVITWTQPGSILYGTALGGSQLNATANVPGTFVYSPAAGTVPGAGAQTLSVTFTPTDTVNYGTATASVTLTVKQATPSITWAVPAPIAFGVALNGTHLDATASVPGTFRYNPASGTVPAIGANTLTVVFTPTDTTNYTTATASVTLNVGQPVPALGSLAPAFVKAGGAAFTLTVNGAGFTSASVVEWGSTPLATLIASGTQLTAQVPASAVASAGTVAVTVQNPTPGGGASNAVQFEIDSAGSNAPPSFGLTTATISHGSSAIYPVSLPATATNVSATCLNLPAGATCSYSSASNAITVTSSSSTPAGTYQIVIVFTETLPGPASAFLLLPILVAPLMLMRRRLGARGLRYTACLALLAAAAMAVTGCGGAGGSSTVVPPETHQITSSGTVTLIVQ